MYTPEQIKAVRLKAGLTQAQAAELIGYSKRAWQDWEQGRKPMRDAAMDLFLLKLAVRDAESQLPRPEGRCFPRNRMKQVEGAERGEREACESDHAEV